MPQQRWYGSFWLKGEIDEDDLRTRSRGDLVSGTRVFENLKTKSSQLVQGTELTYTTWSIAGKFTRSINFHASLAAIASFAGK